MTTVSELFGPPKWSDADFSFDAKQNVILPDGTTIWRHGIGTSSADWQAHLLLVGGQILVYGTAEMRNFIYDLEAYPNTRARYSPANKNGELPTARGFIVSIEDMSALFQPRFLAVPPAALDQVRSLSRYHAGRYAEKISFRATCKAHGLSFRPASKEEDIHFGIDAYVEGEPWQFKLDTPDTGNIFVQTHTNNQGWWDKPLAAANEDVPA